jgi:2-(1,2-epoxy-1,2-dihydrophenyl)acetyl-CoA isomerase
MAALDTGTPDLLADLDGGVLTLTLNRPDARNAMTDGMNQALAAQLARAETDSDVRCIVLTGAGQGFCAGGDVKAMAGRGGGVAGERGGGMSMDEAIQRQRINQRATAGKLFTMPKPTIAALPGAAAGAGFGLALACDLRIAAESAVVTTAYARLGLSGDYGTSWFLTRLAGPAKARELMFGAERVDAATCLALGLVNRVVPDAELAKAALAWAKQLAAGPPIAHRLMKDNLNRALVESLASVLEREAERMVAGAQTEDYLEAVAAFAEKRAPSFKGK